VIDQAFEQLKPVLGAKPACAALGLFRATHNRRLKPSRHRLPSPGRLRPTPCARQSANSCSICCAAIGSYDCAPAQVVGDHPG